MPRPTYNLRKRRPRPNGQHVDYTNLLEQMRREMPTQQTSGDQRRPVKANTR
jgi:hypothetical protein